MSIQVNELRVSDYQALVAFCEAAGQRPGELQTPVTYTHLLREAPGLSLAARREGGIVGAILCRATSVCGYEHELILAKASTEPDLARQLADKAICKLYASGAHRGHLTLKSDPMLAELWKSLHWIPDPVAEEPGAQPPAAGNSGDAKKNTHAAAESPAT